MAGLVFYYDDENHYYVFVTHDEDLGRCIRATKSEGGVLSSLTARPIPLGTEGRVWLRGAIDGAVLRFSWSTDGVAFHPLGLDLDATILSDETAAKGLGFTGAFAGVCVQDLERHERWADFDFFEYRELDEHRTPTPREADSRSSRTLTEGGG
jgi:xylan 1,4-beta-xylosidase